MSRTQWEAVAAAKRIAAEQKIKGVHGMLIELFHVKVHCRAILRNSAQFCAILRNLTRFSPHHVKDDYYTAVETAAGNQLFQMVVDDDEIAAKMIKEMQKQVTRRHCHRLLRRHCHRLLRRHHRRHLHLTSSPPLYHRTRAASPSCRSRGCAPATTRRTRSRRT